MYGSGCLEVTGGCRVCGQRIILDRGYGKKTFGKEYNDR